jgi:hypothetical protein
MSNASHPGPVDVAVDAGGDAAVVWVATQAAPPRVGAVRVAVRRGRAGVWSAHMLRSVRGLDVGGVALVVGALAGAVVLLGGAAALGLTPLGAPRGTQGATSLWVCSKLPGCESPAGTVKVGITSDQLHRASYTVQVSVAGRPGIRFGPITLVPGASWSGVVATGPGKPVVRAVLRTTSKPSAVYRNVILQYLRTRGG